MSSFFGVKIIILFNRKKSQNECSSILSYSNIDNFLKDLFFSYNFLFFQSFLIVAATFNFNYLLLEGYLLMCGRVMKFPIAVSITTS